MRIYVTSYFLPSHRNNIFCSFYKGDNLKKEICNIFLTCSLHLTHKPEGLKFTACLITQRMGLVCMDFNNQLLFVCTDKDRPLWGLTQEISTKTGS